MTFSSARRDCPADFQLFPGYVRSAELLNVSRKPSQAYWMETYFQGEQ